jgi:ABC-type multidrug transport system fused ATPase/permease subunit
LKHFISGISRILNRKEKVRLCILIALDFLIGLLDIAFLGMLLLIINYYTKNSVPNNFLSRLTGGNNSLWLIGVFFLLFGLKNFMGYRISSAGNSFFYEVASRLSRRNILQYLRDDYTRFVHIDSSVHIRRISQQPIEFSNYILTNLQQVISQSVLIAFTVIAILFYHPITFFLLFLLLLPPVVVLAYFIKRQLSHIRAGTKLTSEKTIQYLQESLSGYVESNLYDKSDFFIDRYFRYQQQLNKNIANQQTLQGLTSRLIEVFAVLGFFILVAINKLDVNAPAVNLLTIGVFMAASYKIIPGIVKILNSSGQMKTYEFTLNDLLPDEKLLPGRENSRSIKSISSIKFEAIDFQYKHQTIVKNLNFELFPSDFAGMQGKSGLGKTTIINLLFGFLEQDDGNIIINHKIANIEERQACWPRISYVKQQPFFINDTILKNIILTDDGYNKGKLAEVLAFCGIDLMLAQYPEGINKQITENGKNISGGQRQRLMLARALYPDFDLLILDEPFSEMDEKAEKTILDKLSGLAKTGKIILFITHNKSSLTYCNKLIVPDGE